MRMRRRWRMRRWRRRHAALVDEPGVTPPPSSPSIPSPDYPRPEKSETATQGATKQPGQSHQRRRPTQPETTENQGPQEWAQENAEQAQEKAGQA